MCTRCTKFTKENYTNYTFDISIKILWIDRFIIISPIILRVNQLSDIHFQSTREYTTKIEDKYGKTRCSPWSGEMWRTMIESFYTSISLPLTFVLRVPGHYLREKSASKTNTNSVTTLKSAGSRKVLEYFSCAHFFFPRENFMKNRKRRTGPKIRLVHEFLKNDESKNI